MGEFTEQDKQMMALAIAEAEKAQAKGEVPVGAVLVDSRGEVIAKAHNLPITQHDPTAHAEINLLRKAGQRIGNYRLPNTTLYVTLEPCPMCTGALIHARVASVVYAAKDLRTGACSTVFDLHQSPHLNHKIASYFMEDTNYISILKTFFKNKRD